MNRPEDGWGRRERTDFTIHRKRKGVEGPAKS